MEVGHSVAPLRWLRWPERRGMVERRSGARRVEPTGIPSEEHEALPALLGGRGRLHD